MLAGLEGRGSNISVREIEERMRKHQQTPGSGAQTPGAPGVTEEVEGEDDSGKRKKGGGPRRPGGGDGGVPGRAERHKERSERQAKRKVGGEESRGRVGVLEPDDTYRHRKDPRRRIHKQPGTVERIGKIPISLPITVRSLSEAIGRKSNDVLLKLFANGVEFGSININSTISSEMAELVAVDFGKELDIKRGADVEQNLIASHEQADNPEQLQPRAPVVAVMGHVDHGKTSLLDRIRETYGLKSDIVSTEAGGITQVIRAWRVEKDGHPITFLDTPGHEAFTKMRARGANVTDIAVIVVAANDGVMPQTEEAVSHAKAAEVSIVVAVNKVDLPDANIRRTEERLMTLGLIPDTMGGDVPFVHTSAKTGKGIDELLEQLSVVAELNELTANPSKPASGTCLEAYLSEKEGVQATLLVQNGTLRTGDIVVCGATHGTVRKMYDDLGRVIEEAGPSVPVRILGLDAVPNADDTFHVVPDVTTAADIADERKGRLREKTLSTRAPVTLESLKEAEIAELKVILKAEARGSIEAIRNELEKLRHEEVRVRVLHAAIGGITASDVQLALTSPEDTLIVGFNVVPDNEAKALADERGIQIRQYDIIYKLAEDIRSALEGKLKPREEIIHLGRAVVRETFKISRVGTIAGCFVTQGVIERSAKVRVIRSGVVIYPPPERTAGLHSLKRFKDDVREVREGFECGLKIEGYDDIKVDDIIECYRVEQVQRTLS
jgi:translation initiation factor IF-2